MTPAPDWRTGRSSWRYTMTDYATPYADRDTMANHWWWRPGWQVGTRFYAWHIAQEDHPGATRLASACQEAMGGIQTLDAIPLVPTFSRNASTSDVMRRRCGAARQPGRRRGARTS